MENLKLNEIITDPKGKEYKVTKVSSIVEMKKVKKFWQSPETIGVSTETALKWKRDGLEKMQTSDEKSISSFGKTT